MTKGLDKWRTGMKHKTVALAVLLGALFLAAAQCPFMEEENIAPFAQFTASPTAGTSPLSVAFDASSSSDADGTITSYSWSFGDGTTGSGRQTMHTYTVTSARSFTITLTVRDNDGDTDTTTRTITVSVASEPVNPSAPCNCTGPDLNCADFSTHAEAQACYDYCKSQGYGDVFRLDADKDGIACESLP